ncbi:penicillin-binding protein [Bacillus sp. Marseille-P3661]|uniref:penicillin-binding protein n=1 Tax=Bacillus sp. Marseille-P3661 TaxID=1936234 RepID=UPI000C864A86|nr:penicillin-binding protein [Bacillus sp. Marseille-P3661]
MNKNKTVHIKVGARILSLLFVLLFFVLAIRFINIQTTQEVEGHSLADLAENKWTKERTLEANRGEILDRNGEVIAKDVPTYTLFAIVKEEYSKNSPVPLHVTDPHQTALQLAPLLEMGASEIERRLTSITEKTFQVELGPKARNIDHALMEKIKALKLPGINFIREKNRLYPNGMFASHVVGFAQTDEDGVPQGKMGIERTYNSILQGQNGVITYKSDRKGFKLPDPKEMITPPIHGNNVHLTLDQKIQTFVESALTYVDKEYQPENSIAIVANPKTGEILAMGSRPSFDPNIRDIQNYLNDPISNSFEPGSTFKIFTLAAAIDAGAFNANEEYQSGSYKLPNVRAIRDHNRVGWGKITYLEGVQRSSNVAFAKIVNEELGTDNFRVYLDRFGFHQPTGIDLPNEASGNILYNWPIEKLTTAFGQGTMITPIQQIQAATAIANNGKMMKPFIIKKIVDPNTGDIINETEPKVVGEPIKPETAMQVLDILETVVSSEAGTGKPYRIEGYEIAGKTGTAQIPDPKTGQYMNGHGNNVFSFLGFIPKDDPQLVMYVSVKRPRLENHELGSEPASYIFKTVMRNSMHYLNVAPTEEKKDKPVSKSGLILPDVKGLSIEEAKKKLEGLGIRTILLGSTGKVMEQIPYANSKLLPNETVIIKTDGKVTMPNITGWSLRDIMKLSDAVGLKPNIIGSGYVVNQNINEGTVIKSGDYLVAELKPPFEEEKEQEQSVIPEVPSEDNLELNEITESIRE